MANKYYQHFTIEDIFNNKELREKLPLIKYKTITTPQGREGYRTNTKTIGAMTYDFAKRFARPHYNPLNASKNGNTIIISGLNKTTLDEAQNAIYSGLTANKYMLSFTANNMSIIRHALVADKKAMRETKLYLRANSIEEIKNMSKRQLIALMDNIMENIFYSDSFENTQNKFGVENIQVTKQNINYSIRKEQWKRKVGEL